MARPSSPLLHRDGIVAAALELLRGSGSFTMSQLASALGVRPSSLYNHVQSKAQVVQLIRAQWLGEVVESAQGAAEGKEQLRLLIRGYYDLLERTPQLISLVVTEPLSEQESHAFYSALTKNLRILCSTHHQVITAVSMIDALVLGRAIDTLAPALVVDEPTRTAFPQLGWLAATEPSTAPFLRNNIDALIELLLLGVEALSSEPPQDKGAK